MISLICQILKKYKQQKKIRSQMQRTDWLPEKGSGAELNG